MTAPTPPAVSEAQDQLSCILMIRAQGLDPIIDAVLWPEDQTPSAQLIVRLRSQLNPGLVAASVLFPPELDRASAEVWLKKASREWLATQYRRGERL